MLKIFFLLLAISLLELYACSAPQQVENSDSKFQSALDRAEIIETVNNVGIYADRHNWQGIEQCFADEVLLDYTSMVGGKPAKLKASQIIKTWKGFLPGFKLTQHAITNHKVTTSGKEADCFSYVNAIHYLPNDSGEDTWTVMGYYEHHLIKTDSGWKIDKMKFNLTLIQGNKKLAELAQKAATTNQ
jgi:hypothetical protein